MLNIWKNFPNYIIRFIFFIIVKVKYTGPRPWIHDYYGKMVYQKLENIGNFSFLNKKTITNHFIIVFTYF